MRYMKRAAYASPVKILATSTPQFARTEDPASILRRGYCPRQSHPCKILKEVIF
jgi:hypothetical protein